MFTLHQPERRRRGWGEGRRLGFVLEVAPSLQAERKRVRRSLDRRGSDLWRVVSL
jgi:hypothetical protein